MVAATILGFPRVGANREVKKAVEAFWAGKIDEAELLKTAAGLRKEHWAAQHERGLDYVPVGDFSLYDHILDMSNTLGVIPKRYEGFDMTNLERYFSMGRGLQRKAEGDRKAVDVPASEMKKFFDSNYHYIVPELSEKTEFTITDSRIVDQLKEATSAGYKGRPVVFGPISYLLLAKADREASATFNPLSLLKKIIPAYEKLFKSLADAGAEWIQVDEPTLVLDTTAGLGKEFHSTYETLSKVGPKLLLATYYGRLESNLDFVKDLPVAAIHVDLVREPGQLQSTISALEGKQTMLSLGLVDGRNIWKTDLSAAISLAQKAVSALGKDRVIIGSTSSLLHVPHTLASEKKLPKDVTDWFSFALEKCAEVSTIAKGLTNASSVQSELDANKKSMAARHAYTEKGDSAVRERVKNVTPDMYQRKAPFAERQAAQRKKLNLPRFPTTTIGSFPQTKEIRVARQRYNKGEIKQDEYDEFLKKEIQSVVDFQEKVGLDMYVHGEPERNDMVQYFGELLDGFVFTQLGWVQSYGSRYVRPPIIVGDVSRPAPMSVKWSSYAQSVSKKPMKGMLTGPVTILNWSFPREDVSKEVSSRQLALALRDEVIDLEKAGIAAIQVDEPAIREGLPLRRSDRNAYLTWAVDSFRLATAGVQNSTQTHSHFCYSDFNDMMDSIQRLDADVITIENSKSDAKLLKIFDQVSYTNEIGPGLFDIHSPRVPPVEEMYERLATIVKHLPADNIWANPDCGLKTRGWTECEQQCANLVAAAKKARETL